MNYDRVIAGGMVIFMGSSFASMFTYDGSKIPTDPNMCNPWGHCAAMPMSYSQHVALNPQSYAFLAVAMVGFVISGIGIVMDSLSSKTQSAALER